MEVPHPHGFYYFGGSGLFIKHFGLQPWTPSANDALGIMLYYIEKEGHQTFKQRISTKLFQFKTFLLAKMLLNVIIIQYNVFSN